MKITVHRAALAMPGEAARQLSDRLAVDPAYEELAVDVRDEGDGLSVVAVYFDGKPSRPTLAALADLAREAGAPAPARFRVDALPPTNWVKESLSGLPPVRAGRFLVHGSHDRDARAPNDLAIEIEAGLAFGTGHHGTTVGCLLAIADALRRRPIANAADLGTGTGVLAIAIALAARVPVLATDIDEVAVDVASANCRANGVGRFVRTAVAADTGHRLFRTAGPFDLVVANILAGPLARMAGAVRRIAAPGAALVLSGLLPHQRRRIVAAYRNAGFRLVSDRMIEGWLTIAFQRPKALP